MGLGERCGNLIEVSVHPQKGNHFSEHFREEVSSGTGNDPGFLVQVAKNLLVVGDPGLLVLKEMCIWLHFLSSGSIPYLQLGWKNCAPSL